MAMPLDYARRSPVRPFAEVSPIIDATTTIGAIGQIINFMIRHQGYRVGVPDTSFFPFSAICRLNLTFPSGSYHGTGFYIGDGLILTCGHNLFDKTPDKSSTERATKVTVRVGQQNASTYLASFDIGQSDFDVHPIWESSGANDPGFDLGIIRTTNPPPDGHYFRLINHSPAADTPIAVCGYGSDTDVDSQRQHLDIDKVRGFSASMENVDYNLQTRGGNSGSPVFAYYASAGEASSEDIPVMGVHTLSETSTLNRGVLLTPDKIDWAMGGGNSSTTVFSLSNRRASGAPHMLGGLPLMPARTAGMLRSPAVARPLERHWIVEDHGPTGGMSTAKRTFGHPTHDTSGQTMLSVRVPNMPSGGHLRWSIPDTTHRTRALFLTGGSTATSTTGTSATLRSLAGGVVEVDCEVRDSAGRTSESNKYIVSSPQFVLVTVNPTTDAFFNGIGLGGRRNAIYAEMAAVMRQIYRNVNVRFIFPGETLPLHLGVASNATFPGGVETVPEVLYAEVIGDDTIMDPEESMTTGIPTPYEPDVHGRNHQPGDMPAPMNRHTLARGLVHHFAGSIPDIGALQGAVAGGTLAAAEMDRAATFYGRLMGENLSHEVAHFLIGAFQAHTAGGLTAQGDNRTIADRTGMTLAPASTPMLTDGGRGSINDLPLDVLRAFENLLPVDPPLDSAALASRGRAGSFSRQAG